MFALAAAKQTKTYMFYIDWSIDKKNGKRAYHGSENDIVARRWENVAEEDLPKAETLSKIFASFILTGDPVYEGASFSLRLFEKENLYTLYFDGEGHETAGVRKEDLKTLLPLLREYPAVQ